MIVRIISRQVERGARLDFQSAPIDSGADAARLRIPFGALPFGTPDTGRDIHLAVRIEINYRCFHADCGCQLSLALSVSQSQIALLDRMHELREISRGV